MEKGFPTKSASADDKDDDADDDADADQDADDDKIAHHNEVPTSLIYM